MLLSCKYSTAFLHQGHPVFAQITHLYSLFIAKIFYPVVGDFIFILLALASMLGAAMSDALGKIIQNPVGTFDWIRDTVMKWFGK